MTKERITGLMIIGLFLILFSEFFLNYDGIDLIRSYGKKQNKIAEDYENSFFFDEESLIGKSDWIIQIAAFESIEESMNLARKLEKSGYQAYITRREISEKVIYRVRVFGLTSKTKSDKKFKELKEMGFSPTLIRDGYAL